LPDDLAGNLGSWLPISDHLGVTKYAKFAGHGVAELALWWRSSRPDTIDSDLQVTLEGRFVSEE